MDNNFCHSKYFIDKFSSMQCYVDGYICVCLDTHTHTDGINADRRYKCSKKKKIL